MSDAYGHQVAIRFDDLELKKLDALVEEARGTGSYPRKSRSSVIIDLVSRAAEGLPLGPPNRDERQLELLEERNQVLDQPVDAVEKSVKRLAKVSSELRRRARPSTKKPRRSVNQRSSSRRQPKPAKKRAAKKGGRR